VKGCAGPGTRIVNDARAARRIWSEGRARGSLRAKRPLWSARPLSHQGVIWELSTHPPVLRGMRRLPPMSSRQAEESAMDRSLAYQAALGDVLKSLGRAPIELDDVLATILSHATRLCHAERGFVYLRGEDGRYRHSADIGANEAIVEF